MLIVAGVTGVVMTLALILMVSSATELIRYYLPPVFFVNGMTTSSLYIILYAAPFIHLKSSSVVSS